MFGLDDFFTAVLFATAQEAAEEEERERQERIDSFLHDDEIEKDEDDDSYSEYDD